MTEENFLYDDSFNYIETDVTRNLFDRIIKLFDDEKNYLEREDFAEVSLIERHGELTVIRRDFTLLPVGTEYDPYLIENVVERFKMEPCYSAEFKKKDKMAFIRLHIGMELGEELYDGMGL
jgi:hypothetical protein